MARQTADMPAVPFELRALDGQTVGSKALVGKVVLLNFWATWCGPCKEEMPSLERLPRQLDPQRFAVLTVTTDRQRDGSRHFLGGLGVAVPVLFDKDQEDSRAFLGRAVSPRAWDSPESVAVIRRMGKGRP